MEWHPRVLEVEVACIFQKSLKVLRILTVALSCRLLLRMSSVQLKSVWFGTCICQGQEFPNTNVTRNTWLSFCIGELGQIWGGEEPGWEQDYSAEVAVSWVWSNQNNHYINKLLVYQAVGQFLKSPGHRKKFWLNLSKNGSRIKWLAFQIVREVVFKILSFYAEEIFNNMGDKFGGLCLFG